MGFSLRGRKLGMSHFFLEDGALVVCTILEISPHVIVCLKTLEKDGYTAIQFGCDSLEGIDPYLVKKRLAKPLLGTFEKKGITPCKTLFEVRVSSVDEFSVGQIVDISLFKDVRFVDVSAVSKGKGYQGVMKRCGFKGHGASHGTGPIHRHAGSRGQRSTPGRIFPLNPAAGRLGGKVVSVQNLEIVWLSEEDRIIAVQGSVPGATGRWIDVRHAVKKHGGRRVPGEMGGAKCQK